MVRKLDQELREAWRNRVERQRQSDLTVAQFCQREGVSATNFYAWKRKLRAQPSGKGASGRKSGSPTDRQGKRSTPGPRAAFVQLPLPASLAKEWIEVVLADGTVVRLPQENLVALETVLRTLRIGPLGAGPDASSIGGSRYA